MSTIRDSTPIAAVYDRRMDDASALVGRRYRTDQSVVAAVYDRRSRNDYGSHRQPLQGYF